MNENMAFFCLCLHSVYCILKKETQRNILLVPRKRDNINMYKSHQFRFFPQ